MLENRNMCLSHFQTHQGHRHCSDRNMQIIFNVGLPSKKWAHPTDSATGLVDSSDTNTWQANLWSAGCFVMKPKYLKTGKKTELRPCFTFHLSALWLTNVRQSHLWGIEWPLLTACGSFALCTATFCPSALTRNFAILGSRPDSFHLLVISWMITAKADVL